MNIYFDYMCVVYVCGEERESQKDEGGRGTERGGETERECVYV